jgi:hypothetical protein
MAPYHHEHDRQSDAADRKFLRSLIAALVPG